MLILPVHIPNIWSLNIPPRVQFFLWLLGKNKVLTRDNLAKRQGVEVDTCLFCDEKESCNHLFFECTVAKCMWEHISLVVGELGASFESIGSKWLSNKKFVAVNIISSAALWGLWKLRNEICFQNTGWRDMKHLLSRILGTELDNSVSTNQGDGLANISCEDVYGGKKSRNVNVGDKLKDVKALEIGNWLCLLPQVEKALAPGEEMAVEGCVF